MQTNTRYTFLALALLATACSDFSAEESTVPSAQTETRRSVVYTIDPTQSRALDASSELVGAYVARYGAPNHGARLVSLLRDHGADAAVGFFEGVMHYKESGTLPSETGTKLQQRLPCTYLGNEDAARLERDLAMQLQNAGDVKESVVALIREYDRALTTYPDYCSLLAGRSLAVLGGSPTSTGTPNADEELAVRRLLVLAAGGVTPSGYTTTDLYAALATHFAAQDDYIAALIAIDRAMAMSQDEGLPRTQLIRLETWRSRITAHAAEQRTRSEAAP